MAGIVIGFACLVAVCVAAGLLAWESSLATKAVFDSIKTRRFATLSVEQLLVAENTQRTYLMTNDSTLLAAYTEAAARFSTTIAQLRQANADDPEAQALAAAFEHTTQAKLAELSQTMALQRDGHPAEALAIVRSTSDRALLAEARLEEDAMIALYNSRIQAVSPRQTLLAKVLLITIAVAAVGVVGLSLLVLRDTRRTFRVLEGRETALRQLAASLEQRVERRTRSLREANARFDAALRAARVTVYTQDSDLRFTWISKTELGLSPEQIIGRANSEVVPAEWQDPILRIKQRVLDTGEPGHGEVRITHDGVEKWYEMTVHPTLDAEGRVCGLIGGSVEITERKEQEARIRLLMRELTHRSKNLLSVIQAIMRQTAAGSTSTEDFEQRFSERLQSLAGSHDLLVLEDWNGASLQELIRSQLGHYSDLVGSQVALSGPPVHLNPDAAQHIGMALHELATNAAKYGALSSAAGHVRISWTAPDATDPEGACTLEWEERDGPPVTPPTRRGFGRVVTERTVARAVGGKVSVSYPVTGVRWSLVFPRSALA